MGKFMQPSHFAFCTPRWPVAWGHFICPIAQPLVVLLLLPSDKQVGPQPCLYCGGKVQIGIMSFLQNVNYSGENVFGWSVSQRFSLSSYSTRHMRHDTMTSDTWDIACLKTLSWIYTLLINFIWLHISIVIVPLFFKHTLILGFGPLKLSL